MRVLILGGTVFLGRHLVEAAQARGHEVTLFNRGQHNPELYPDVEKLRGDRDGDLTALKGRHWDVVIDPSGYVPRIVTASARLLADAVEQYTFISSISVYADFNRQGIDESYRTATLADPTNEDVTANYGALKALCERAAEAAMPDRVLNVRAGLIVGPHDPTNRFTYWPARVGRGGDVLAPRAPDVAVQLVDARDLADWTICAAEARTTGDFNATGPEQPLTLGMVLETSRMVTGSDARFVWVDERFLTDAGVQPWMELPLWVPDTPEYAGFSRIDCRKAYSAGLTFRPLIATIRDTLEWDASQPSNVERRAGMRPEREAELLATWRNRVSP